eukprot:3432399-Pyramimonas_sp.AAC.1
MVTRWGSRNPPPEALNPPPVALNPPPEALNPPPFAGDRGQDGPLPADDARPDGEAGHGEQGDRARGALRPLQRVVPQDGERGAGAGRGPRGGAGGAQPHAAGRGGGGGGRRRGGRGATHLRRRQLPR